MLIATGTGRSGTGTIAKVFGMHHEWNVQSITRHFQPGIYENPLFDRARRERVIGQHLAEVSLAEFRDSSNPYIHFLDLLYEMDADIRIVLLVRDVRDFCVSAVTRGYHWRPRYDMFSMRPMREDPAFERWAEMNELQRTAWMWDFRNRVALDQLLRVPADRYRIVKIEDFYDHIDEIAHFFGIRPDRSSILRRKRFNRNSMNTFPSPDRWLPRMHQDVLGVAGETMLRLGYDVDRYREKVPIRLIRRIASSFAAVRRSG